MQGFRVFSKWILKVSSPNLSIKFTIKNNGHGAFGLIFQSNSQQKCLPDPADPKSTFFLWISWIFYRILPIQNANAEYPVLKAPEDHCRSMTMRLFFFYIQWEPSHSSCPTLGLYKVKIKRAFRTCRLIVSLTRWPNCFNWLINIFIFFNLYSFRLIHCIWGTCWILRLWEAPKPNILDSEFTILI